MEQGLFDTMQWIMLSITFTAKAFYQHWLKQLILLITVGVIIPACVPYSVLQQQVSQKEEIVSIKCEWVNKGYQLKRLVFCDSKLQYMLLHHKEPWITYDKQHFQRYISYLLKRFFNENDIDISRFQFAKVFVWLHVESLHPENVSFYMQIENLLFHLPLLPSKWAVNQLNTYYFPRETQRFPHPGFKHLAVLEIELKPGSSQRDFFNFIRTDFPEVSLGKSRFPLSLIKVPVFQEVIYGSKIFEHPGAKKYINDIRPIPGPGVKLGNSRRVFHFDLFMTRAEKEKAAQKKKP